MRDVQLSLYDLLGYIIPGFILFAGVFEIFNLSNVFESKINLFMSITPTQWVVLIIISYIIGHCLHSFSNLTLDRFLGYPPKRYFDKKFKTYFNDYQMKEISTKILIISGMPVDKREQDEITLIKSSYWLCYTYIINNSKNSLSPIFLSLTGFYRGLVVSFALLTILAFIRIIFFVDLFKSIHLFVFFILFVLFSIRTFRFFDYLTNTVYTEFLIIKEEK